MVVDQFFKWVECFDLSDQTTERVARLLVSEFIERFGCPLELHSDQGSNVESRMFKEAGDELNMIKTRTTPYRPHGAYAARHQEAMRTAHREARKKLHESQPRQKRDYDLRLEEIKCSVCDAVYIFNKSIVLGQSKKIQPIWSGPWNVTQVISSVLYRIDNRKLSMVAHNDSLQLCSGRDIPIWFLRNVMN